MIHGRILYHLNESRFSMEPSQYRCLSFQLSVQRLPILVYLVVIILFGATNMKAQYQDSNKVANPCGELRPLKRKDAITLGLGLAGPHSVWYNGSDISLNILSPCSSEIALQVPVNAKVALFRPVIEQIALLRLNNASYVEIKDLFPGNASLIFFAGKNPTVFSLPRYFLTPYGRVAELTLVLNFEKGRLNTLLWKNDNCRSCGTSSSLCVEGTCVTPEDVCLKVDSSNTTIVNGTDPCRLAINIAFSGTDKYNQLLSTWYQFSHIQAFSLSGLYLTIKSGILQGLASLDRL